jgi:hypothetical protein
MLPFVWIYLVSPTMPTKVNRVAGLLERLARQDPAHFACC